MKLLNLKKPNGKSTAATGAALVIQHMRQTTKSLSTQWGCLSLIKETVEDDAMKVPLVKHGCLEQTLISLKFHGSHVGIASEAMEVLYYLAFEISDELSQSSSPKAERAVLLAHALTFVSKISLLHKDCGEGESERYSQLCSRCF